MTYNPAKLESFIISMLDPAWEPAKDAYAEHLVALNRIAVDSGVFVEGGLFNLHGEVSADNSPAERMHSKRRHFALFSMSGTSMLEIGFNAGHSAMLALAANPDLVYHGVDIGHHAYTMPCFEYLRSIYGDRVRIDIGDSRDVLPALRRAGHRFDLYHIDGGHGFSIAQSDLCNVLDFAEDGDCMMMDDTDNAPIDGLCDFYQVQGHMTRIQHLARLGPGHAWNAMFRLHPKDRARRI